MSRAIFIDKDGTLVDNVPHNVDPRRLVFAPHALDAARRFFDSGFKLIVVSNQPGVAEGRFDHAALTRLMHVLASRMADAGAPLAGCFACTPGRAAGCSCRKPAPGLLNCSSTANRFSDCVELASVSRCAKARIPPRPTRPLS